jgi:DNA-binding NarL/FixJ family response regulator
MPKTNFVIAEKSYLIRKGLISLIDKIPNTHIIHEIDQSDELFTIHISDADFIIINSNLINQDLENKLKHETESGQLILISDIENKRSNSIKWTEKFEINESQNSILKKLNKLIGNRVSDKSKSITPDEISDREADILRNIALGYSNKEIADKLFISTHTVVTHRKNITRKLGIKTVPGLTIYAILNKLININDQSKL